MTASPALDQVAAHVREWRSTPSPMLTAISRPANVIAARIAAELPDVDPTLIGAVPLHASQAATEICMKVGATEPGLGPVIANTLGLAGESLYTRRTP